MNRSLELYGTGFGFHCPSGPGNISMMTANLQDMGGKLSLWCRTSIPGWKSGL